MYRERIRWPLLAAMMLVVPLIAAATALRITPPAHAQACPPRCPTPIITPAWHLHMCDLSYQEQLEDNHCMYGDGVTEFPAGTDQVYIIYCHRAEDLVVVQVKDAGGGLQYVNHPDGITYTGDACETLVFAQRNGIAAAGSPYYTSAYWPEGPFSGVSRGIEWFIGLFVAFDFENYYGTDALAQITARDPAANLDIAGYDEIVVHVTSTSDPAGIDVVLREEAPSFPIFAADPPLTFSTTASDEANHTILVANRDQVTVSYCPRNCQTPYTDTATWYQIVATITPTPLPTYGGPPPTATATPPPDTKVEYVTLRPAPDDVGYVPQISANRNLPNHLGYPTIYSGMWTHGQNQHYGMIQFDLSVLPEGAAIRDARLEMIGRDKDFTDPGRWAVYLLADTIDSGWRTATFADVQEAGQLAQVGSDLTDTNLAPLRANSFGHDATALGLLNERLATTRKASYRVDGPSGEDDNLFGWHSGVDKYRRDSVPPDPALGPSLHLSYVLPGSEPSATPGGGDTATPGGAGQTATPPLGPTPTGQPGATSTPGAGTGTPAATETALPTPTSGPGPGTTEPTLTATPPGTPPPTGSSSPSATAGTPAGTATSGGPSTPGTASPSVTAGISETAWPSPDATVSTVPPSPETPPAGGTVTATSLVSATPATPAAPGTPTAYGTQPPTAVGPPTFTPTSTPDGPRIGRQVCVVAFDDYDGDGYRDAEERFLPGVTIKLTHTESTAFVTWTTNGTNDPDYCWSGLTDGAYTLAVTAAPLGYAASGAYKYEFEVPFPGSYAYYGFALREPSVPTPTPYRTATLPPTARPTATVSPTPSVTPTATPQPTVDGPSGEICVAVFLDADGDGRRQGAEEWIRDVRVRLVDRSNGTERAVMSRDDALVCSRLATGVYYVRAELAPGLVPSTTHEKAVLLTESQRQIVEFGQRPPAADGTAYLPVAIRSSP